MDKVLVTGGNGFIGSFVVEELVKTKRPIRCLVQKGSPLDFIQKYIDEKKVEIVYGDVTKKNDLEKAISGIQVVYHFVALAGKQNVTREQHFAVNYQGTVNLLELAVKHKIKKFIYCSSVGVMGNIKNPPANEKSPYSPTNDYEETKMEAEKETIRYTKEFGLDTVIIRPAIVYGPRNISNMSRMFQAVQKGKFFVIGSGKNLWHMTYIEDLAKGFIQAERNSKKPGEIYILAGEKPVSMNEMTSTAAKLLGVKPPKRLALPLATTAALGFGLLKKITGMKVPIEMSGVKFLTNHRYYDITKAKEELGYSPKTSLREGLEKAFRWYKENGILE